MRRPRHAGEGGPARGQVGERGRRVVRQLDAEPGAQLGRPGVAVGDARRATWPLPRRRWTRPSRFVSVPSFSSVCDSGTIVVTQPDESFWNAGHLQGEEAARERVSPALAGVPLAHRVGAQQHERLDRARLGQLERLLGRGRAQAGGGEPDLVRRARRAQDAAARRVGDVREHRRHLGPHRARPDQHGVLAPERVRQRRRRPRPPRAARRARCRARPRCAPRRAACPGGSRRGRR